MSAALSLGKKPASKLDSALIREILKSLKELGGWGSVEIYVQNSKVTQITRRVIRKTSHRLKSDS
jgi:hypothetical protein